jgi:hypothetical protein
MEVSPFELRWERVWRVVDIVVRWCGEGKEKRRIGICLTPSPGAG